MRACRAGDTQFAGDRLQRFDDEADVFVQVDAELVGALNDVVAVDGAGEALVLHLLALGPHVHLVDALAGPDDGDGDCTCWTTRPRGSRRSAAGSWLHPR